VGAIVHTHSRHISALTTKLEPVRAYNIVAAPFVGRQVIYVEDGEQPPVDGKLVAAALSDFDTLLISNHGVILTAPTLEEATVRAVLIEQAARFQLEATAIGGTELPDEAVRRRVEWFRRQGFRTIWDAHFAMLPRTDADLFPAA
jgi:L-fuculose-phosphate aldolase